MGQVVDIAEAGTRRDERGRDADAFRALHPDLRWVAGRAFWAAHRKDGRSAACGARGDLVLAPPGVPRCVDCYPLGERDVAL